MNSKVEVFRNVLNEFEDESMRLFCEDLLSAQDDMNYSMPSSTSYKYHNKTQCGPGGQILHVLMVASIMNYLLGLEYIREKFPKPKQRDCMRIAAICHDIKKTNGGQYTIHEHPILADKYVQETPVAHDIDSRLKAYIGSLCASHSGQWVDSNRSSVILPKPSDDAHFYIHLCDYLSSRSNIDMIYDDKTLNLVNEFQSLPDINNYTLPFGKFKGYTIPAIDKADRTYLEWAAENMEKEPARTLIRKYMGIDG